MKPLESNLELLKGIEPKKLWEFFSIISCIPRQSKNEMEIVDYLINFALDRGLNYGIDQSKNIVIIVPASMLMEDLSPVCLQAHLDMVCEKTIESNHDFFLDSIEFELTSDNQLKAKETSLGADNGIGVAAMLAIADSKEISHGPLELLFTVDEETGLVGASALPKDFIKSKTIINLDTEEFGKFYISCAGSTRTVFRKETSRHDSRYDSVLSIEISGLKGGHSGTEIGIQHANVFHIVGRILNTIQNNCDLVSINGGTNFNAIPRDAELTVTLSYNAFDKVKKIIRQVETDIWKEIYLYEPDFKVKVIEREGIASTSVTRMEMLNTITFLLSMPHGVTTMSPDMDGLVQTSTNLGMVSTTTNQIIVTTMQRGSVDSELHALTDRITLLAKALRFNVVDEFSFSFPGWKANPNSKILEIARDTFFDLFEYEPEIVAIHAGLECGVLSGKFPESDIISFGPTITKPHSPDEKVDIASVDKFWDLLLAILVRVA